MSTWPKGPWLFGLLLTSLLSRPFICSAQEDEIEFYSLSQRMVVLQADGTAGPYQLPDRFLLPGRERVWVDHRLLLPIQEYSVDYDRGLITFHIPLLVSSLVQIQYEHLPFSLQEQYFHRRQPLSQDPTQNLIGPLPSMPSASRTVIPPALRVGGSKTFAISLGSERDLSLEQSLRVNISGQVSPDVEVVALLSDQSSPLQPEGDTQTLEEIDKVLIEIRAKQAAATLGDYEISFQQGEFGRFERKLQGAKGTAQISTLQMTVAGAVSRGVFRSMSISGIEGKQGPYQLTDDRGSSDLIVLAGTERVWVDGEAMARGQNNDYIIEYGSGQITFTMHRLITAESRIVVDYEYSNQEYKRSLYAGQGRLSLLDDRLALRTLFIRESDDGDSPIDVALSREDRSILQAAGDDPDAAWRDGWVLADTAGGEEGDYIWVDSTYFAYVGPDSVGIYNVAFSDMGSGNGEYVREFSLKDNRYYYVYLGDGDRRYLPRTYLPLPGSQSMADLQVELSPLSTVRLGAELGLSQRDENTLSARSDQDNLGRGLSLEGKLDQQSLRIGSRRLGQLDLMAKYRSRNERFRTLGRDEVVEYDRRWDLDRDRAPSAEQVRELAGVYRPTPSTALSGEYGHLSRGDLFTSTRRRLSWELKNPALAQAKAHYEVIESQRQVDPSGADTTAGRDTRWTRRGLAVERTLWKVRPSVAWDAESRETREQELLSSGDRYQQLRGGISTVGLGPLTISSELIHRQDHLYEVGWLRKSLARTLKNRIDLQSWQSISLMAEYTRRSLRFQEVPGTDSQVNLIETKMAYAPLKGAVNAQVDYRVSNSQGSQKRRIPVDVGEGQGEYRLEEGEYIPDPEGNWVFRIETVGDSIPVTDLAVGLRLGLTPHRAMAAETGGAMSLLWNLSADTFIKIDEQTTERDKTAIYFLQLDRFQRDETTLRGEITFQQDLFLFPQRRDLGVRLRYLHSDRENNQYVTGGEENLRVERSARLDLSPGGRPVLRVEYSHDNTFRKVEDLAKSRIRADDLSVEATVYPTRTLEMAMKTEFRGDRDAIGQTRSRLLALTPKWSYSFLGQGRLRSEFTWAHVTSQPEGAGIAWEMAQGNSVGDNYRLTLSADYQVNQYISATVSYTWRAQPNRPTQHLGRAEMRAFF